MAEDLTVESADKYIESYVIDIEDWEAADDTLKQRIINVANRTLTTEYPDYMIPSEAVYEFCATLSVVFNDTNRLQQHGVASFSVTGAASFTFKESTVDVVGGQPLTTFIPQQVHDMLNAANPEMPKIGGRHVRRTVM